MAQRTRLAQGSGSPTASTSATTLRLGKRQRLLTISERTGNSHRQSCSTRNAEAAGPHAAGKCASRHRQRRRTGHGGMQRKPGADHAKLPIFADEVQRRPQGFGQGHEPYLAPQLAASTTDGITNAVNANAAAKPNTPVSTASLTYDESLLADSLQARKASTSRHGQ